MKEWVNRGWYKVFASRAAARQPGARIPPPGIPEEQGFPGNWN
jgi:hypothetical protein